MGQLREARFQLFRPSLSGVAAGLPMKRSRGRRGQGIVEFALVLPLLLVVVFGLVEFGRAWMTKNILTGAAREGVRRYAVNDNVDAARGRAAEILSSAGLTGWTNISTLDNNGLVSVQVDYDFPVVVVGFVPGLDCNVIRLSSITTMRKEY